MYVIASKPYRPEVRGPYVLEYRGLSTDEKPTGDDIASGSVFYEMDAKKVFMYDSEAKDWLEQ